MVSYQTLPKSILVSFKGMSRKDQIDDEDDDREEEPDEDSDDDGEDVVFNDDDSDAENPAS